MYEYIGLILNCLFLFVLSTNLKTVFRFERKINTCDPEDRPLQDSTSRVIWAYHEEDPINEQYIKYHEQRGVTSIRFFNPPSTVGLPPEAQYFDVKLNNDEIIFNHQWQGPTITYWCSVHQINTFTEKHHIIRAEPVIDPRNIQQVHHIELFSCTGPLTDSELTYNGGCMDAHMPTTVQRCRDAKVLAAWATGSTSYTFPENVGLPIGPDPVYILMQIHYDNPTSVKIIDSSGIRFWYTAQLRTYDAGIMEVGLQVDNAFKIPAHANNYPYEAWCPGDCTRDYPTSGINVIGARLHTHIAGKSATLSHIRSGVELAPILSEPYYDFNYQDFNALEPPVTILPGDDLRLTCYYDTTYRTWATQIGESSNDEMCSAYLIYYPAMSGNQSCRYGDYTNINSRQGKTLFCSDRTVQNWSPRPYKSYVPPECIYQTPSNTSLQVRHQLITNGEYERSQYLDYDQKYKLHWTIDKTNAVIRAAVEVETGGWIGLGISPSGMEGADILIAWVKNGEVYFSDRFAPTKSLPRVDEHQDYFHISGGEVTLTKGASMNKQIVGAISAGAGAGAVLIISFACVSCVSRRGARRYRRLPEPTTPARNAYPPVPALIAPVSDDECVPAPTDDEEEDPPGRIAR